ncbi:hypothetical protein EJB05_53655, partial [Eragrostis curvula]
MVDVRAVIASWFIMLKQDTYVLIRIESLVALVTVMFLVMFILDIFRCRTGSSTITNIMKIVDGVSDQIVVYLIGAMQSAGFKNQLFPVWAIVLVSLRASLGYLSGYSIVDRERRITEVANVIKFIGAGVLNGTRALEFTKPLWLLWAILTLRSMYKFVAHGRAIESLWHGRSSEFLPEYLHVEHSEQDQSDDSRKKMYLVYGEANNKDIKIKKPGYNLHLEVTNQESLLTLHKINEMFPKSTNSSRYNDMSLAFALSRLLRCRLEDVPLHTESITMTRKLIISEIIKAKPDEAFRILELELAFVRDYFYTLYPMVFWRGLFSLSLSLLQSIATFTVTIWLAVGIRKVYKPRKDNFVIWVNGWNVDVVMTWVFMFFMIFKEAWEMVTYLLSNWTRLLLVCKYAQNQHWCITNTCLTEGLISSFFKSKIAKPWHGMINQYDFLNSCTYMPRCLKLAHTLSLGQTPEKYDGRKVGAAIKVPESVKEKILKKLHHRVYPEFTSLRGSHNRFKRYQRGSLKMHTCSQIVLVWHIATRLCAIKLTQEKNVDLSKPGFLNYVWSGLKKLWCCSSQSFLVDEKISLEVNLKTNYQIANSLSRYCAYLLVFRSELLPDSFSVPDAVFEDTLQLAQKKLKDCDSTLSRYTTLMETVQDNEGGNFDILQQGAMLAKDLIDKEGQEKCWEILAAVWTDLLVDIAPSWNAEAHKHNLESGGEFITLIWALLWHCGIEKSGLSHEDNASENTSGKALKSEATHNIGE